MCPLNQPENNFPPRSAKIQRNVLCVHACVCVCMHASQHALLVFRALSICVWATLHSAIFCYLLVQISAPFWKFHMNHAGIFPTGSVLWFNHCKFRSTETEKSTPRFNSHFNSQFNSHPMLAQLTLAHK